MFNDDHGPKAPIVKALHKQEEAVNRTPAALQALVPPDPNGKAYIERQKSQSTFSGFYPSAQGQQSTRRVYEGDRAQRSMAAALLLVTRFLWKAHRQSLGQDTVAGEPNDETVHQAAVFLSSPIGDAAVPQEVPQGKGRGRGAAVPQEVPQGRGRGRGKGTGRARKGKADLAGAM